ncbi:UNVERIFIED_CONTAM: hypothetical protein FKN15_058415 [Acipenser sinensis]
MWPSKPFQPRRPQERQWRLQGRSAEGGALEEVADRILVALARPLVSAHDWLVCAQSKEQLAQHTVMVTDHLQRLGLKVNPDKSRLVPSQQTEFLGLHLDSVSMEATLSTQRVASLERCLSLFRLRETVSMELCQRMLGLMAAASQALPLGLLHQRPLQAWFNAFALHPRRDKHRRLRVSRTCWEALRWWKVPSNIRQGVRLGPIFRREPGLLRQNQMLLIPAPDARGGGKKRLSLEAGEVEIATAAMEAEEVGTASAALEVGTARTVPEAEDMEAAMAVPEAGQVGTATAALEAEEVEAATAVPEAGEVGKATADREVADMATARTVPEVGEVGTAMAL